MRHANGDEAEARVMRWPTEDRSDSHIELSPVSLVGCPSWLEATTINYQAEDDNPLGAFGPFTLDEDDTSGGDDGDADGDQLSVTGGVHANLESPTYPNRSPRAAAFELSTNQRALSSRVSSRPGSEGSSSSNDAISDSPRAFSKNKAWSGSVLTTMGERGRLGAQSSSKLLAVVRNPVAGRFLLVAPCFGLTREFTFHSDIIIYILPFYDF
jgi:hypothetical protein